MNMLMRGFHGLYDTQYGALGSWRLTKREFVPRHIVTHSRRLLYQFRNHFHPYAERLVTELIETDIAGLQALDTRVPELRQEFFNGRYQPKKADALRAAADIGNEQAAVLARVLDANGNVVRHLLPVKELDFDYAEGAYAVYNWEVFYHIPFMLALHLSRTQRYAAAQRLFHYIFDPIDNSSGTAPQRFWKVKPFQIDEVEHVEKALFNLSTGDDLDLQARTMSAIGLWRDNPFRPHLVARTRPTAYMYATVMAYLDNLIAWGDSLFRQDTREAINEAMQYYVLAANILGPKPQPVPKKGSIKKQTYADLRNDLDEFGNAVRDLEAEIPFDLLGSGNPTQGLAQDVVLESLGRGLYFCVPRNDKLIGYWDTVADRLFKIRNSLNLQGVFRQLPLFPPPLDPAMLARAAAAGVDVASIVAGTAAPLAPVRFQVLLQKALEMCQEVKSLGGQILAALEKRDNEALSVLRAKHESNLLGLAETVRYAQWQEAIKNREGIEKSIQNAAQRHIHFERLLGRQERDIAIPQQEALDVAALANLSFRSSEAEVAPREVMVEIGGSFRDGGRKVSPSEAHELDLLEAAQIGNEVASALESIGAFVSLVPDASAHATPVGVGAAIRWGGTNLGHLFRGLSSATRGIASRVSYEASRAGRMASFDRREQDWAQQSNLAAGEVTQLFKQLRAAELREHIARREYDNHKKQVAQARDVEDFLTNEKRKTSNEHFYLWTKREAQGLHARCFQLAFDVAKKAERAFQHEIGDPAAVFLGIGYLGGREGLFAGEKLYLDVKRMDLAFSELNTREFELTKHISLRDWFPLQLLELRATGKCEVDIPEALFDLDCPGHLFRRIKSLAVLIPCVTGPYASVNCSITLLRSHVRTKGSALGNAWYPADPENPDTERFTSYPAAVNSIVTSGAQGDMGMFEPNLRDERYLPFEGAGVICKLALELPGKPRQFDLDTIADVVLSMRYTARAGASAATASTAVTAWLKANSAKAFSMRHEFPSEWARFTQTKLAEGQLATLSFRLEDQHFPYRMQEAFSNARQLHLFGRTTVAQVEVESLRNAATIGKTLLANGEGVVVPPAVGGNAGSFDPRGTFELRFDTTAFDDLWVVVDWSTPPPGP